MGCRALGVQILPCSPCSLPVHVPVLALCCAVVLSHSQVNLCQALCSSKACSFSWCVHTNSPWLPPTVFLCYCQQSLVGSRAMWLSVFETCPLAPCLLGVELQGFHFGPLFIESQEEWALVTVIFHPDCNLSW